MVKKANKVSIYSNDRLLIILKVIFFLIMIIVGAAIFLLIAYMYNYPILASK